MATTIYIQEPDRSWLERVAALDPEAFAADAAKSVHHVSGYEAADLLRAYEGNTEILPVMERRAREAHAAGHPDARLAEVRYGYTVAQTATLRAFVIARMEA